MMMRPASKKFHIQTIGVDGETEPYGEITSASDLSRDFQQSNLMIVERAQSARLLRCSIAEHSNQRDGRIFCVHDEPAQAGIVLFERDNLLLRRRTPSRDFTLLDLDQGFVNMLSHLRKQKVAFGFLSDQRGMDASTEGWRAYLDLVDVLDTILNIQGAMPDFWITPGNCLKGSRAELSPSYLPVGNREFRALSKFLRVDDQCTATPLYVCGSCETADAASQAGFASIRYARQQSMQAASTAFVGSDSGIAPFDKTDDPAQLYMLIKDKLSLPNQAPVRQWLR